MTRHGIITPVLTLLPGAHARWERDGTFDDVVAIARAADALGYDHLTCSEHVIVPTDVATVRGGRYWDPAATLGYLAAVTERIRLTTSVVVLGYHHPLALAKRYGTLDRVFELLGADFDDRGARADDALRALRGALSNPAPSYDGEYYSYDEVVLDPCALQEQVPIWVGGRTARSLRRAVELADGWCPFGLDPVAITALLRQAAATPVFEARDRPLDVVLQSQRAIDPLGDPDATRRIVAELEAAGATTLALRLVHRSVDHYIEQLAAFRDLTAAG